MAKKNKQWNQISAVEDDKVKAITRRIKQKKNKKHKDTGGEEKEKGRKREITSCSEGDVTIKGNRVIHWPTGSAFPLQQEGRRVLIT